MSIPNLPVGLEQKPKKHYEPAYDGLSIVLNKMPALKNPAIATPIMSGSGTLAHLRSLANSGGNAKKRKEEKERQKAEARIDILTH